MGDDGGGDAPPVASAAVAQGGHSTAVDAAVAPLKVESQPYVRSSAEMRSPDLPPGVNPLVRRPTSLDLDDYFKGPRDIDRHSKWPLFMRVHGSILPKMIVPLLVLGGWATLITAINELVHSRTFAPRPRVSRTAVTCSSKLTSSDS
jgi:ion channel-forming bestrophin family protein